MSKVNSYKKLKIGVLGGGFSDERSVSLRSMENVRRSLNDCGYQAENVEVKDDLLAHLERADFDLVFNVLHGTFGEDGHVQALLEWSKLPYTGENLAVSSLCFSKIQTKLLLQGSGLPTGQFMILDPEKMDFKTILNRGFELPFMLKRSGSGSSVGVYFIDSEEALNVALKKENTSAALFVEEYLKGVELTVGMYKEDGNLCFLPYLELRPKKGFYDYEAKYTKGMTEMILPAEIASAVEEEIREHCRAVDSLLEFNNCVRVDFIVKENKPYILEINTQPGMTETSDIPAMLKHAGVSMEHFLFCNIENAMKRIK